MNVSRVIVGAALLLLGNVVTWGQTGAGSVEPGVTESRVTTRKAEKVEWTHPAKEFRGVWFASNNLREGKEKTAANLDLLKRCNFNAVMIDAWFRGFVAYPGSEVAPQFAEFEGEDVFGAVVRETKARGMQAHGWISYGFYAYHTVDAAKDRSMGPVLDKWPELAAVRADGTKYLHNKSLGDFYSLCPSNPKSHEVLGKMMVEVATKYPVDGIHLDRIRYPEADYCYCSYCREHFKADTGAELQAFEKGSADEKKWVDWKREQTLKAVRHFREVVQKARPGMVMTAYVLNPDEMGSRAQGWDLWMKEGLLNAVAVSMYGADIRDYTERGIKLLGGDARKMLNAVTCDKGADIYTSNLQIGRNYGTSGAITWWMGDLSKYGNEAALKAGPYSVPAEAVVPDAAEKK